MILTADYHTHTKYSDGKSTILENALRAKELGLKEIAITEHGFTHVIWGIRRREKQKFIREIEEARKASGMKILVGIEGNILGRKGTCDLTESDFADFDVYVAGMHIIVHYESLRDFCNGWGAFARYSLGMEGSKRMFKDQTQAYIHAIERNPIDIISHLNYECYCDPVEVAKCCRDYGTYLEISGKKPHLTDEELYEVAKTGVKFVLNSDAHSSDRIADVKIALEQIERVGIPHERIDNVDGRLPNFRLKEYKERHL